MGGKSTIQNFFFNNKKIELFVPGDQKQLIHIHSPYWAKVWPASIGLCMFLQNNLSYIKQKKVLELAAGLGLAGIYAAHFANSVCLSDIEPQAVAAMERSVLLNNLDNVNCRIINWDNPYETEVPDVLLLSDINYEPSTFDTLLKTLHYFLGKNCTIILSTPQRLMAKPFINKILPWCMAQHEVMTQTEPAVNISIFVLSRSVIQQKPL